MFKPFTSILPEKKALFSKLRSSIGWSIACLILSLVLSSETGALAQASDPSDASDPLAKLHWIDGPAHLSFAADHAAINIPEGYRYLTDKPSIDICCEAIAQDNDDGSCRVVVTTPGLQFSVGVGFTAGDTSVIPASQPSPKMKLSLLQEVKNAYETDNVARVTKGLTPQHVGNWLMEPTANLGPPLRYYCAAELKDGSVPMKTLFIGMVFLPKTFAVAMTLVGKTDTQPSWNLFQPVVDAITIDDQPAAAAKTPLTALPASPPPAPPNPPSVTETIAEKSLDPNRQAMNAFGQLIAMLAPAILTGLVFMREKIKQTASIVRSWFPKGKPDVAPSSTDVLPPLPSEDEIASLALKNQRL